MKYLIITILLIPAALRAQDAGPRNMPPSSLSVKETAAYEAKAESKVAEFYSYLELITDPKGNAAMKQQATDAASKLFINSKLGKNIFDTKADNVTVKQVLDSAKGQRKKYTFEIKNFDTEVVIESVTQKEWKISYQLIMNNITLNISQSFFIVQENKKFGNTTKKVTNTYLGGININ
jgi:hypothetical protein